MKYLIIILGIIFSISSVRAQSINYDALEKIFDEPITTSAIGSPQKVSDTPVTIEIITADDIARSGETNIANIISRISGVNIIQPSTLDRDISIRGYNEPFANRLLVLVDGKQVYVDFFGTTQWASIPVQVDEIKQIEIIKGPNTALFGFNAAAGVINIITKNPAQEQVNSVTQSLANGAQNTSAVTTFKIGSGSGIKLSAGYDREVEYNTQMYQGYTLPSATNKLNTTSPSTYQMAATGIFKLSDDVSLLTQFSNSWIGYNAYSMPDYDIVQVEDSVQSYRIGATWTNTPIGILKFDIYDNATNGSVQNQYGIKSNLAVAHVQDIFQIGNSTTIAIDGAWRNNTLKTLPLAAGTVGYDVYSSAIMINHKFDSQYEVTGAINYADLQLYRNGTIPSLIPQNNQEWNKSIDSTPSYNLSLVDHLSDNHTIKLMTSRGLELPNLTNFALLTSAFPVGNGQYGAYIGNPNLNETVVTNYELSWDWDVTMDDKITSSVFYQINSNIIAMSELSVFPPDTVKNNILISTAEPYGNSDLTGLEISYKRNLPKGWKWGINGTVLKVRDHLYSDQYLRRINYSQTTPQFEGNVNIGWANDKWTVDAYFKFISATKSFETEGYSNINGVTNIALTNIPAYEKFDLNIGYNITDNVSIAGSVHNAFNAGSISTNGYKMPTTYGVSVKYSW